MWFAVKAPALRRKKASWFNDTTRLRHLTRASIRCGGDSDRLGPLPLVDTRLNVDGSIRTHIYDARRRCNSIAKTCSIIAVSVLGVAPLGTAAAKAPRTRGSIAGKTSSPSR